MSFRRQQASCLCGPRRSCQRKWRVPKRSRCREFLWWSLHSWPERASRILKILHTLRIWLSSLIQTRRGRNSARCERRSVRRRGLAIILAERRGRPRVAAMGRPGSQAGRQPRGYNPSPPDIPKATSLAAVDAPRPATASGIGLGGGSGDARASERSVVGSRASRLASARSRLSSAGAGGPGPQTSGKAQWGKRVGAPPLGEARNSQSDATTQALGAVLVDNPYHTAGLGHGAASSSPLDCQPTQLCTPTLVLLSLKPLRCGRL